MLWGYDPAMAKITPGTIVASSTATTPKTSSWSVGYVLQDVYRDYVAQALMKPMGFSIHGKPRPKKPSYRQRQAAGRAACQKKESQ